MNINFLLDVFKENKSECAIVWNDEKYKYSYLLKKIDEAKAFIEKNGIEPGDIVALEGDFSPVTIAFFLGLTDINAIVVPLTKNNSSKRKELFKIAKVQHSIIIDKKDCYSYENYESTSQVAIYEIIRQRCHPGLVLFSSGTSGEPKAAVHDFKLLLKKFETKRSSLITINFLLFDHWGGLNTMLHILSNGGQLIATKERSAEKVCHLVEKYSVELLPSSPTFLNLLLLSNAYKDYDLSSLRVISYGTEPMPENTLLRLKSTFPDVKLLQTYGLIELGVLRSKSESNDSLWVKVGGEGYETRIIDGILQIKAESAMLGYLNAESPFTDDGWFITGDEVLEKDGFIKILGRKSEIINVGGEKVYPQEIENIILEMDDVIDVTVFPEDNAITGKIVCARVSLKDTKNKKESIQQIKKFCRSKMKSFMVPVKINISKESQFNSRFKKKRA